MIVTAGLTPAWQQILRFPAFRVGEVNRASEAVATASGKVLNVGVALAGLGAEALTLAPIGGLTGEAIAHAFTGWGVRAEWIRVAAPTRVCVTILDQATGATTELVENASPLTAGELADFERAFARRASAAAVVVLIGSLSAGAPSTFYRDLLTHVKGPAIIDGRGPELWAALERRPLLVKPNREELGLTVGEALESDDDVVSALKKLRVGGARWALATDGPRPAWLVGPEGAYRVTSPSIRAVNPIGSGDCLAAGVAVATSQGASVVDAVRFGMGAAIANALDAGVARIDAAQCEAWSQRVVVERWPAIP